MQPEAPPPERPTTDQQPLQPVSTASPAQAAQAAPAAALPSPASSSAPAPSPAPPPEPKEPDAGLGVCTAAEMQKQVQQWYGADAVAMKDNPSLGRIISQHHASRVGAMLEATEGEILLGGPSASPSDKCLHRLCS